MIDADTQTLTALLKERSGLSLTGDKQYLFESRRDVLRLVSSAARPDDETRHKISVVEKRLVDEYGYDPHSAREALNYVTTLLAQE